jgi:hypothetical protein
MDIYVYGAKYLVNILQKEKNSTPYIALDAKK